MGYEKKRKYVSKDEYLNKLIKICIDGSWQADNVNIVKHIVKREVEGTDYKLFFDKLAKFNSNKVSGFWSFYFDGPNPPKKIPNELEFKLKEYSFLSIAQKSLEKVQLEWQDSH